MPTKIVPLGPSVLVRADAPDDKTAGGIVLPDGAKEKPRRATVLEVGTGYMIKDGPRAGERVPLELKQRDRIYFAKYSGSALDKSLQPDGVELREGEELIVLREHEVLCILREE